MINALLASISLTGFQSQDISSYVQGGLRDLSFKATVVKKNLTEAQKIDSDYSKNFSFGSIKIFAKEPFKLRLEAQIDDTNVLMITNNNTQVMRIPKLRMNQKTDLTDAPGRKQTFLDFGMITGTIATQFYQSKFVRIDRATGAAVFDLTFPAKMDNTTRQRVWIDKALKYTIKREWYGQTGQLKGVAIYSDPATEGGVAFPRKFQMFNAENKLAAETKYTDVKINDGIADEMFKI
jgi:outer membrane lipoprotein-sorting protein